MSAQVIIELEAPAAECGGVVRGEVRWSGFEKPPRRVVVGLVYQTAGAAEIDREVDSVAVPATPEASGRFELRVPLGGPITYDGHLFQVAWGVRARADIGMERDPTFDEPVAVLPADGITLWARQTAPPPDPTG